MAIYLSRVNQKLFNARQLLADLDASADRHRQQWLLESLLFQLHLACHFHLRHIAAEYQCPDPEGVNTAADLVAQLDTLGKSPAEAQDIVALTGDRRSWWHRLTASWQHCFRAGDSGPVKEAAGMIPLTRIEVEEEFTTQLGREWLAAMTEMVTRHREGMVEF